LPVDLVRVAAPVHHVMRQILHLSLRATCGCESGGFSNSDGF
jgi:hypothetical protein